MLGAVLKLIQKQESSLPLTEPRDPRGSTYSDTYMMRYLFRIAPYVIIIIKPFLLLDLAAEYTSMVVRSTVVRRPSEVYDTRRRTNLTAPETISRSGDMLGAYRNLNGSRDLTTSLSGMICHPWSSSFYHQPTYKIEVSNSTHYEDIKGDIKGDTKCREWSGMR